MGILERSAALTFALAGVACYEPDLRDCTVACASATDCAAGQICGADHFCAEPGVSGSCPASLLPGDAGATSRDAGTDGGMLPIDAAVDAPPDAPPDPVLMISIEGKGRVTVQGIGSCDSAAPQNGQCSFAVAMNSLLTVDAQAYPDWRFDRWTTAVCGNFIIPSCTFVMSGTTPVGIKFRKEDH